MRPEAAWPRSRRSIREETQTDLRPLYSDQYMDEVVEQMNRLAMGTRLERSGHMVQEHLSTGGKRLRARLALAAGEALGGRRGRAVPWAAACELLHNATLVHDDIQDEDRIRRDQPTVWVRHGVGQAINCGDLLLMLPFRALETLDASGQQRWLLSAALARRAEATVRGQSLEMDLIQNPTLANYLRATTGKTGALLALPVEGAAILSGLEAGNAAALAAPFVNIGLLFQLQDDVLDLYGDKGRGECGCDLKEGKVSILVVEHLQRVPEDREWLMEILSATRERTSPADIDACCDRFAASGTLDAVLGRILDLVRSCEEDPLLRAVPDLHGIAKDLIALSLQPISHLLRRMPGEAK